MGTDVSNTSIATAYRLWAPVYDLVFGEVFKSARRAGIAAAEAVGGSILEVGIGTGISLPFYSKSTRLVGVDISEPMLRKAQIRVTEMGYANVEGLAVMDASKMAFADNSFDVIVAQLVVTTVPDPEGTLDEFMRLLKPGGEIVLISRVGADSGPRRIVEQALTPITRRIGWRLEFPWSRYERWVARRNDVTVMEHLPMAPFGHFSLIRFGKREPDAVAHEIRAA
ncbi:class I SAM-dependent methyltransferase [Methylocapsa palsarum]|uniref:Phosphatidylethanolamine/phosphatidyl-N-methylethanolamine N-methyltransferase n=1 Tax=Methylocapsa palsarum TaxID=1612308 RepID=A0A1I3Y0E2_9HYPH|nr:class I SAM-dependent methyltransferase [Methylocapsa palsarum]SFK25294.1 phosphatidylethanolamine/phosphatidyl-N-methylethanolamine N-methyltransferase [Methylocapsa palsarum]